MNKIMPHIVIIVCIGLFLAVIGFADGLSKVTPPNSVETAVSTSTADKQIQPVQTVRTQAYEPQYTYVNRIPDEAQLTEIPEEEIIAIARMMYGECNGSWIPKVEKAAVCWVVCNRVDSDDPYFPDTIAEVIKQSVAFYGYKSSNPVTDELYEISKDVLTRWYQEKAGETDVGRVIPSDYLWFTGNGRCNVFRNGYSVPYDTWDFSLTSPYQER